MVRLPACSMHTSTSGERSDSIDRCDSGEGFAPRIGPLPSPQTSPTGGEGAQRRCRDTGQCFNRMDAGMTKGGGKRMTGILRSDGGLAGHCGGGIERAD